MAVDVRGTVGALDSMIARLPAAALEAARGMGALGEAGIKRKLGSATSAPGSPPALRSGDLQRSVRKVQEVPGPYSLVMIAPTTVYARIQEMGGDSGVGHATHLPPRPYVRPALDEMALAFREPAIAAIRAAMAV